ncbi:hypothetical protein [Nonomuraea sp. SYSU D8015]|uniref:hypothetical protein n=1 Tax=Nonomuraea sp. SYSU D8015 TaxID=2593644 RepID=UPI001CB6D313|nr:hypothetical protein [Nonomuraea sp. SYSU D8015]
MASPEVRLRPVMVAAELTGARDMPGWVRELRQQAGRKEALVVSWMEEKTGYRGGLVEHGPAWLPMERIRWIHRKDLAALVAAMTSAGDDSPVGIERAYDEGMYLPEWPDAVRPPSDPDWEESVRAWLLDQVVPYEWRFYEVLCRHPLALARMADHYIEAAIEAARTGYRQAPMDLKGHPETVVEEVREVYSAEGPRLIALSRGLKAVRQALRGEAFVETLRRQGRASAPGST